MKKMIMLSVIVITFSIIFIMFDFGKKTKDSENQISVEKLQNDLLKKEDYFVYFYQTDCLACKETSPIVVPMAKEMNIDLKKLNLQEDAAGWKEFEIKGTPTIVYFKNGKEENRIFAKQSEKAFKQWFEKNNEVGYSSLSVT